MVKIVVAAIAAQACLASAVSAGPAARPVVVDMAVNVVVDAPTGDLSAAAEAISAASASGNNYKAQELLSELFSGGVKAEKAEPVHANNCCHCCVNHSTAAPAAAVDVSTIAAVAVSTATAPAADPVISSPASASTPTAAAAQAAAAKEAAQKEKEEARKLKGFAWGVTIMTVALIFLIILL